MDTQLEQFVLLVSEQEAARYLPAGHVEQFEHGDKPEADQVLPPTQPGIGTHEFDDASQT